MTLDVRFERVEIVSFGKLHGVSLELREGFNLLCAPNESGKSTLAAFLRFVFYGFTDARKKELSENDKKLYMPWDAPRCEGSVTLCRGEKRYRVTRSCASTGKDAVTVVDVDTGRPTFAGEVPGVALFGVSEDLFSRTLFFRQLTLPQSRDEVLAEQLQNLAVSADEAVSTGRALDRLNQARHELKGRAGAGWIPRLEQESARLAASLTEAQRQQETLASQREEQSRLQAKLQENQEASQRVGQEMENLERWEAAAKLAQLQRLQEDVAQKQMAYETTVRVVGREHPDVSFLTGLLSNCAEKQAAQTRAAELEASLAAAEAEQQKLQMPESSLPQTSGIGGWIGILLGVGLLLTGSIWSLVVSPGWPAYGMWVVGGLLLLIGGRLVCKHRKAVAEARAAAVEREQACLEQQAGAAARLAQLRETAERERQTAERLRKETDAGLQQYDIPAGEHPEEALRQLLDACHSLSQCRAAYESAVHSCRLASEGVDLDALRARACGAKPPVRARSEIERERTFLRQQQQMLSDRERVLSNGIASLEGSAGDPALLTGKRGAVERKLAECRRRYDVYELAMRGIQEASDRMKCMVAPRISAAAGRYFAAATGGAYRDLAVDTRLALRTQADGIGRECEFLSAGTRDCAYLSLRLALTDLLFDGVGMPLVLDDAFGRLDDARLQHMLHMLEEAAARHQVLLLCCTNREQQTLKQLGAVYHTVNGLFPD